MVSSPVADNTTSLHGRRAAGGFSFAEVLFAVVILGIGFILIAAALPVGIQQTRVASDQTIVSDVASDAVKHLTAMADGSLTMPETVRSGRSTSFIAGADAPYIRPLVWSFRDIISAGSDGIRYGNKGEIAWQGLAANMIYKRDPKFAWTAVFSRTYTSSTSRAAVAQAYIIVSKVNHRPTYEPGDVSIGNPSNLQPKLVQVRLTEGTPVGGPAQPDIIEVVPRAIFGNSHLAVGEGSFVVICDDRQEVGQFTTSPTGTNFNIRIWDTFNGRLYRVGARRPDRDVASRQSIAFELAPGFDMPSGPGCGSPGPDNRLGTADDRQDLPANSNNPAAFAFVVGRGYVDPSDPAKGFVGEPPDVGVFTAVIPIKN